MNDIRYMQYAIKLAQCGVGRTMPNPSVGCVLVRKGQILAQGWTADNGRPHAEAVALANAVRDNIDVRGATAYVTLEPCAHYGETPPCALAIVKAGINRVVYACNDLDSRVSGKGAEILRESGVEVIAGVCRQEASSLYTGFFQRINKKLPQLTIKVATSLDGHIANAKGESQWITGDISRRFGHLLRSRHEAILTGIGTVIADNPSLTCRIKGLEKTSPIRVIMDRQARLPLDSKLVQTAKEIPVCLCIPVNRQDDDNIKKLKQKGVDIIAIDDKSLPIKNILQALAQKGISSVMCEAGSILTSYVLDSGLAEKLYWFRAAMVIGAGGIPAITADSNISLNDISRLTPIDRRQLGSDVLEIYSLNNNL